MENPRVRIIILLILTWLSTWYVTDKLVIPNVKDRIKFETLTLAGQNEPPYRYRLFEATINKAIQDSLLFNIKTPEIQHIASYALFLLATFGLLYSLLYRYLCHFFDPSTALLGLLLFQIVVPLSITGYYMEGDFVTLVVYLIAFNLILGKQERWLPFVILGGAFVREQTVFILLIYHYANHTISRRSLGILITSGLSFGAIYVGLRVVLGITPTTYTPAFHISENLSPLRLFLHTIPLWLGEIVGFVVLSVMAYRKSPRFFQLALISLVLYVTLFFFNGLLNELGKFLPAFLILIPMSLQVIVGKYIEEKSELTTELHQLNAP